MLNIAEKIGITYNKKDKQCTDLKKKLFYLCSDVKKAATAYFSQYSFRYIKNNEEVQKDQLDECFKYDYLVIDNENFEKPTNFDPIDIALLFNIVFPDTLLYISSEDDILDGYVDDGFEECCDGSMRTDYGRFELSFYRPDKHIVVTHEVATSEHFGENSELDDIEYDVFEETVTLFTHTIPNKEFIRTIIEKSTEKGYTELTALLLDKCKDILTSDDPLEDISFDDDDENEDDEDDK